MTQLNLLFLFSIFSPSKKTAHWLLVVGDTVGIPKSDVNDGLIMTFQEFPNQDLTPTILFSPPVKYLFVRSAMDLMEEGFAADTIW